MNLLITAKHISIEASCHPGMNKVIIEDAILEQTNNTHEILFQLDQKDVIEFMEKQGFIISKHEVAA